MWGTLSIEMRIVALLWLLGMMALSAVLGYRLGRLKGLCENMATLARIKRQDQERRKASGQDKRGATP